MNALSEIDRRILRVALDTQARRLERQAAAARDRDPKHDPRPIGRCWCGGLLYIEGRSRRGTRCAACDRISYRML